MVVASCASLFVVFCVYRAPCGAAAPMGNPRRPGSVPRPCRHHSVGRGSGPRKRERWAWQASRRGRGRHAGGRGSRTRPGRPARRRWHGRLRETAVWRRRDRTRVRRGGGWKRHDSALRGSGRRPAPTVPVPAPSAPAARNRVRRCGRVAVKEPVDVRVRIRDMRHLPCHAHHGCLPSSPSAAAARAARTSSVERGSSPPPHAASRRCASMSCRSMSPGR